MYKTPVLFLKVAPSNRLLNEIYARKQAPVTIMLLSVTYLLSAQEDAYYLCDIVKRINLIP